MLGRRSPWVALLVSVVITSAATTRAQDEPEDEAYRTLIRDAVSQGNDGHYQEALALFLRAHAMRPSARTWRGIGLVRFELSDYAGAIEALESALGDTRRPLDAEARGEAQATLARARQFVGRVELVVRPAGGSIDVDGRPARPDGDGALLLNPGRHQLTVAHEGYRTESRLVTLEGGEAQQLRIELSPNDARTFVPSAPLDPGVRVELEGNVENLALHAVPVSVDRQRPTHTEVCVAPCQTAMPPGVYQLAIARGVERPIVVGEHPLRTPTHLLLEYGDRADIRIAGWVTMPLTIAATVGIFFLTIPLDGTAEDISVIGAALGTLTVGLSVSIPMISLNNTARVSLSPFRTIDERGDGH